MSTASARRLALADMLKNELEVDVNESTSALSDIFVEEPPTLSTFVTDKQYLSQGGAQLGPVQYDFVRHFEQIFDVKTYILMVEEFGEYWSPVRFTNEFAIEWGKGSTAPNSLIFDAKTGQWVRLDSFEGGAVASAYPEDGKVYVAEGTKSFREGYGSMYRVTTKSGLTAEVWEGHRYLNRKKLSRKAPEWQRLWDLKVGDWIAVSSFVPEPTESVRLPNQDVEIAGLFVGDGCCPTDSYGQPSVCGGSKAKVTFERTQDLLSSLPNSDLKVAIREDGKWDIYTKMRTYEKFGNPLRVFLRKYGLEADAYDKRIPEQIFSAPTDQVALFVSRLIDTDGWVSISNTVEVGYGTVNLDLAEDLRRLLLRLGVACSVKEKRGQYKEEAHTSYQVKVRDRRSVQVLLEQIRLLDKEPKRLEALDWCIDHQDNNNTRYMLGDLWFDTIETIEYIGEDEYWTLSVDGPADYISNSGILDHNSGKDHCCQICFARTANLLLCLHSPQGYYGMPHQTIIHMLNVAASAPQAHGVFFKPLRTLITRSPWFADKFENDIPGPQAQEIRFKNQLELISGHSQAETLEGKNLLCAIADEISAFPTNDEVQQSRSGRTVSKTSDSILEMLRTSATTRFPKNFKLAQISFPRYKGDAIEQAIAISKADIAENGDKSQMYVSGPKCTWDVNPRYDEFERVVVEGASDPVPDLPSIIKDYKSHPAMARAKYECKPELAESRFFNNDALIFESFSEEIPEPVEFVYYWGLDEAGVPGEVSGVNRAQSVPGWQVRFVFHPDFRPISGCLYAVHGDMAIKGDRAGVAMAHVRQWEGRDWATPGGAFLEQRPIVKVDFATAFEADAGGKPAPREVQIRWYRKLIWALRARGFEILFVSHDNFQSADSMQILETWGIETEKASTDRTPELYNTLRDVMYDGRLEGYKNELLIEEIRRLSLLKNGKIDHPPNGSKDIADSLAGAVSGAVKIGGSEGEVVMFADSLESEMFMDGSDGIMGTEYAPDESLYGNSGSDSDRDMFGAGTESFW